MIPFPLFYFNRHVNELDPFLLAAAKVAKRPEIVFKSLDVYFSRPCKAFVEMNISKLHVPAKVLCSSERQDDRGPLRAGGRRMPARCAGSINIWSFFSTAFTSTVSSRRMLLDSSKCVNYSALYYSIISSPNESTIIFRARSSTSYRLPHQVKTIQ